MIDILINKVVNNREYLAWYFHQYMTSEKKSLVELLGQLEIDQEKYYKAALCKAPPGLNTDFPVRVKQISDYIGMNVFPLVQIIRSVDNSIAFNDAESINATLMAAREKRPSKDPADNEMKDD